jgi:DNA-binding transcriptional MocR family regulator
LLPPEITLAEQLGVNRSTVREGIRLLEESGLVTRLGGKRLRVRLPHPLDSAPHVQRALVSTSSPREENTLVSPLLPPTTRRSIVLIRSERSALAARNSAIVCCNVLTFDPSDTIPPSTAAIYPIAAT